MYKFRGNLGVKLTAMILFTAFVVTAALSGAAIAFSVASGVYFDEGEALKARFIESAVLTRTYDISQYVESAVDEDGVFHSERIPKYTVPEDENFCFAVTDIASGTEIYRSRAASEPRYSKGVVISIPIPEKGYRASFDDYQSAAEYAVKYAIDNPEAGSFSVKVEKSGVGENYVFYDTTQSAGAKRYLLTGFVDSALPLTGNAKIADTLIGMLYSFRHSFIWCCAGSVVLVLVLFVFLMCSAGRKSGVEGVYLCWSDKIPFDIVLAYLSVFALLTLSFLDFFSRNDLQFFIAASVAIVAWIVIVMCNVVSFAARAKAGDWWKNTVIFMTLRLLFRFVKKAFSLVAYAFSSLPTVWRMLFVWAIYSTIELLAIILSSVALSDYVYGGFVVGYLLCKAVATVLIAVIARQLAILKKAGEALSSGAPKCSIDKRFMFGDIRRHADNLESIGDGIERAVERQMKSERMKTELITNVSHDIKTPLTSIISYVDLLKKEKLEGETARSYIEVIDRQATRLKKLTEDLVEASKAQSGNITVEASPCDIGVLLSQGFGEYEERMREKGLTPQLTVEDGTTAVVDGKLLWRVFDNLFGNICKYAMPGTRVYVSEEVRDGKVVVTFKNITNTPIEISPDELTERFVRADKSRSSEGSGLGLSISKSLTELMNGSFEVTVDGDLFKVEIRI